MNLKHLYWKYFGYPDLPPRTFKATFIINRYTGKPYFPRYMRMANMYLNGYKLQDIADEYNTTRERIRQCIWKAYWHYIKN